MKGCRVFVGGLGNHVGERDLSKFFRSFGRLHDIVMKTGYCFVEFGNERDADDAVYKMNGKELIGRRVAVEKARAAPRSRPRAPMPRRYDNRGRARVPSRTNYRLIVKNLSSEVSWQKLKYFMRDVGEVNYADAHKYRRNEGVVEFATYSDMKNAMRRRDRKELCGRKIKLVYESDSRRSRSRSRSRSNSRSRSSRSRTRSRSRSRSRSHDRSRSRSRSDRHRSRSNSRSRSRSRSRSHSRSNSRSRRSHKQESRSRSHSSSRNHASKRSRSDSRSRSRSPAPKRTRTSRSPSAEVKKSRSKTRSRSQSPVLERSPKDEQQSQSRSVDHQSQSEQKEGRRTHSKSKSKSKSRSRSRSVSRSRTPIEDRNKRSLSPDGLEDKQ